MALTDPDAQTPDMQGAGMPAPPQAQSMGGLIDALRSRGTLPANIAQTMQPVGAQPNSGLAFGSGVLNALSGGNAAANPYLQQHQEQQNKQFWQQRELARMQSQEQARKAKQEEAAFKISSDLLKSDQPEARATGAQGVMRYMKGLGMQAPESLIKALATRRMTDEQMNSVYRDIHLKMADPEILAKYPGLSPDVLQQAKASKDNPLVLKTLGLKSPEEQRAAALDLQHKEFTGWAEQHGVDPKSNTFGRMLMLSGGKLEGLTDPQIGALRAQAEKDLADRDFSLKMRGVKAEAEIKHADRMAEIRERETLRQTGARNNPQLKPQIVKWQQELSGMPMLEQRKDRVKQAVELLNKEGLLPSGGTMVEWARVQVKIQTKVNRPDINAAFNTLQRFGTPLLLAAEKDLAGQPIGSVLRLKSVAEAEIGGMGRIPYQWWQDFFSDYETGLGNRKALVRGSLEAAGISPTEALIQKRPITRAQYDRLIKKGASDVHIRERYDVLP